MGCVLILCPTVHDARTGDELCFVVVRGGDNTWSCSRLFARGREAGIVGLADCMQRDSHKRCEAGDATKLPI